MDKNKQYKTFDFPNRLTPLEQYYYYLLEFQVVPKTIPADKVVEIFSHAAKDYLQGFLPTNSFSLLTGMFAHQFYEYSLPPGVSRLLDYCSELDDTYTEEIVAVKKLLDMYVNNTSEFTKLVQSGKMNDVFTD